MSKKEMVSREILQNLFDYKDTGELLNKGSPYRTKGRIIGTVNAGGYKVCRLFDRFYYLHQLIYIYHHGTIPDGYIIDHKDHDRSNNQIENLQILKFSENSSKRLHKKSSNRNVSRYNKDNTKWITKVNFGPFDTEDEAVKFRENILALIGDKKKVL